MTTYDFEKLQGAGNDFIFIEDLEDRISLTAEQVSVLCDRHFGIGADGVILVKPPQDPSHDGFMHYINADGSLAQMCGNGVRCFAKYLIDHGIVDSSVPSIAVETRAGVKSITFTLDSQGKMESATVAMGKPILEPPLVPTTLPANATTEDGEPFVKDALIDSPWGPFAFTCLSMGNPHAVTFVEDFEGLAIDDIGAYFESCSAFPEKSNIEFAKVGTEGIAMRVYERGCGETLACGTGACATGVAAYLTGRAGLENDLLLRGGILHIAYEPEETVLMTGPAAFVFSGSVDI